MAISTAIGTHFIALRLPRQGGIAKDNMPTVFLFLCSLKLFLPISTNYAPHTKKVYSTKSSRLNIQNVYIKSSLSTTPQPNETK